MLRWRRGPGFHFQRQHQRNPLVGEEIRDVTNSHALFQRRHFGSGSAFVITKGMKVLIVDDADSANALGKLLRGAGHSCDHALDTSQAVAVAATYHFDVAFIDVGLADHGAEALASVLKEKGIKSIALTRFGAAPARFS